MSMELIIGRKFEDYSKMFPDQIVNLSTEIQQAQSDVSILFENDIKEIRRIMNEKKLNININFTNFERPVYLITTALYSGNKRPKSKQDVIRFLLANLYRCRDV
jgi:subtilase family serine protease